MPLLGMINKHSETPLPPRQADQRVSGFPGWLPPGFINKTSQDSSGMVAAALCTDTDMCLPPGLPGSTAGILGDPRGRKKTCAEAQEARSPGTPSPQAENKKEERAVEGVGRVCVEEGGNEDEVMPGEYGCHLGRGTRSHIYLSQRLLRSEG